MAEKKNNREDRFLVHDGDFKIIFNPNDKQKKVFIMDEGWQEELDMVAQAGGDDEN